MGSGPSRPQELEDAEEILGPEDVQAIREKFREAAQGRKRLTEEEVATALGRNDTLDQYAASAASERHRKAELSGEPLTEDSIVLAAGKGGARDVIAGREEEQEGGEGGEREFTVNVDRLYQAVKCIFERIGSSQEEAKELAKAILPARQHDDNLLTESEYKDWERANRKLSSLLDDSARFQTSRQARAPELSSQTGKGRGVVSAGKAWLLSSYLQPSERSKWSMLYSTSVHGLSFGALASRCRRRGPVLLAVRDTQGKEACGVARPHVEEWTEDYGEEGVMVASLIPRFRAYRALSKPERSVRFRQGFSSEAYSDCFAFVSEAGQEALGLGPELFKGTSGETSMFRNDQLLGDPGKGPTFEASEVEAWALDPTKSLEERKRETPYRVAQGKSGKAVDKFREDNNFLQIATGQGGASEGLR